MMSIRSTWTMVALAGMAAAVVTGCGGGSQTANQANQTASSGTVNLKLGMWASSPAEKQLAENQLKSFEQQNPNIHVDIQVITGNYLQASAHVGVPHGA